MDPRDNQGYESHPETISPQNDPVVQTGSRDVEFIGKLITIEEAAHRLKELFRGERWCGIFQTDDNILGQNFSGLGWVDF